MENIEFTSELKTEFSAHDIGLHNLRAVNNNKYYELQDTHIRIMVNKILRKLYDETGIDFENIKAIKNAIEGCLNSRLVADDAAFLQFKDRVYRIVENNKDGNNMLVTDNIVVGIENALGDFNQQLIENTSTKEKTRKTVDSIVKHITDVLNDYRISVYSLQDFMRECVGEEITKYNNELDEYQIDYVRRKVNVETKKILDRVKSLAQPQSENYEELARQFK